MARLSLFVICSLLAVALLSCGGDDSETSPESTASITPTAIASAQPSPSGPDGSSGLQHLEGETMAFDYPPDWNVWSSVFNGEAERIVIANIPQQPETDELPEGAIKIAFESPGASGPNLSPVDPLQIITVGPEAIPIGLYEATSGARWSLRGMIDKDERLYYAFVEMNTEEPALDVLKQILDTWTFKT